MGLNILFLKEQKAQLPQLTYVDEQEWIPVGEWVPCSPAWLNAGGDCACAPRVYNNVTRNHYHPPVKEAVARFSKMNALLDWLEKNISPVTMPGTILELQREHLEQLNTLLEKLTPDDCEALFPTQDGFHFGPITYGELYWQQVNDLRGWLSLQLRTFVFSENNMYVQVTW